MADLKNTRPRFSEKVQTALSKVNLIAFKACLYFEYGFIFILTTGLFPSLPMKEYVRRQLDSPKVPE